MSYKTKRKNLKLTQKDMANMLGITQVAYGNYELGKRQPKPEMLKRIARIFGCSIDELLEDLEDDNARTRRKIAKTA